jgi:hypothetical protein
MKPRATFALASFGALLGVVAICVATVALGHRDVRIAGLLGGGLGVLLAVYYAVALGWLPAEVRGKALLGGIAGLIIAWVVVMTTIDTIVLPILSFAFVGAGVVAGAQHDGTSSPPPADVSPDEEL